MRKTLGALAALTMVAGTGFAASLAQAQPYPYGGYNYPGPYGGYSYDPYSRDYGGRSYDPRYNYGGSSVGGIAGALLGSLLGDSYGDDRAYGRVPVDRYGPDPNGMIDRDGRRIKCKLKTRYDPYGRGIVYRDCWST